jgi:hypothetical protein
MPVGKRLLGPSDERSTRGEPARKSLEPFLANEVISVCRLPRIKMFVRLQITALVYMMVQAVMFGVGVLLVLSTPLEGMAMQLMPWVVGVSALVSLPVSWMIAPRLRARYWQERGVASDLISGPSGAA